MYSFKQKTRAGFTLIELLVVIVVIGVISVNILFNFKADKNTQKKIDKIFLSVLNNIQQRETPSQVNFSNAGYSVKILNFTDRINFVWENNLYVTANIRNNTINLPVKMSQKIILFNEIDVGDVILKYDVVTNLWQI